MARCAACGQPKAVALNTSATAARFGGDDGFVRRVVVVGSVPGWPPGSLIYVTGDDVDGLVGTGAVRLH